MLMHPVGATTEEISDISAASEVAETYMLETEAAEMETDEALESVAETEDLAETQGSVEVYGDLLIWYSTKIKSGKRLYETLPAFY